jgi:hypothetical protein
MKPFAIGDHAMVFPSSAKGAELEKSGSAESKGCLDDIGNFPQIDFRVSSSV